MPIEVYAYVITDSQVVDRYVVTLDGDPDANGDGVITEAEWDAYLTGGKQLSSGYNALYNGEQTVGLWDADNNAGTNGNLHNGMFYAGVDDLTNEEVLDIIQQLEDTNNAGIGDPVPVDEITYCFAEGSLIRTPRGEVPVEDLQPGDIVDTLDHGPQAVRWIGCSDVPARGDLTPIRIRAGALGDGLPHTDLVVSPHHRMVVTGWRAEVLFGEPEVLAAARDLINDDTIRPATDLDRVRYFHVLFDRHEIIWGNGAMSESFHPADCALDKMAEATRDEILRLFPELKSGATSFGDTARMVVGPRDARMILQ